jgi:hypothetical protein
MFKNLTPYLIASLLVAVTSFTAGLVYQRAQVEDDCAKLGGFYFGNNVYQCYTDGKK